MSGSKTVFGVWVQPETGAARPPALLHPVERGSVPGPGGLCRGHRLLPHRHVGSEHRGKNQLLFFFLCSFFIYWNCDLSGPHLSSTFYLYSPESHCLKGIYRPHFITLAPTKRKENSRNSCAPTHVAAKDLFAHAVLKYFILFCEGVCYAEILHWFLYFVAFHF